jgi:hypothetical protein
VRDMLHQLGQLGRLFLADHLVGAVHPELQSLRLSALFFDNLGCLT